MGNQQFTVRNARFSQCDTAIYQVWNWGWTYKNITIDNCQVGMVMQTGTNSSTQATASELALDWSIKDTPVGIRTTVPDSGTLVLENIHTSNVPVIVDDGANKILLAGSTGSTTVDAWAQGHIYYGKVGPTQTQGPIPAPKRPASLLDKSSKKGYYFERDRPQYEAYAPSDFVSVKDHGAKGDGKTDDTAALQSVFESFACEKIVYVPQGTYLITDTLKVPIGTRLVGEVVSTERCAVVERAATSS